MLIGWVDLVLNRPVKQPKTDADRQGAIIRRLQNSAPTNKAKYHAKKHDARDARRAAMERGVK